MSEATPQPTPTPVRASPKLVAGGALVVILGFGLPALFGGSDAAPAPLTRPAKLAPEPIAPPAVGNVWFSLLKLGIGLAVMCGACVLVAKYVAPKPPAATQAMTVAAALRVGACTVHLVVAGDRRLLVGTDGSGVKAVLELPPAADAPPEPPAAQQTVPADSPGAPAQTEIIQLLLKLRDRTSAPG